MCTNESSEELRSLWLSAFDSADINSVRRQISDMLFASAVFRLLDESRDWTGRDVGGSHRVHDLINQCYYPAQLMTIRRLCEGGQLVHAAGPGTKRRDESVHSLPALILHMRKNRCVLTRERLYQWTFPQLSSYREEFDTVFDLLAGVRGSERQPVDCVAESVFDHLLARLRKVSDRMLVYVNKFLAHASTIKSREALDPGYVSPTYIELWSSERAITEVFQFISVHLLSGKSVGFISSWSPDISRGFDTPMIAAERFEEAAEVWGRICTEYEAHEVSLLDSLLGIGPHAHPSRDTC